MGDNIPMLTNLPREELDAVANSWRSKRIVTTDRWNYLRKQEIGAQMVPEKYKIKNWAPATSTNERASEGGSAGYGVGRTFLAKKP